MNGYIAFYRGKRAEVYADTKLGARDKAATQLKVPKSQYGLLAIELAEIDGEQAELSTAAIN